ncbi:hypothetical protein K504DRAFT_374501, partial [Pleomassaria siparia CBS 279.74]
DLRWAPCFQQGLDCANLPMRFDYSKPSVGTTTVGYVRRRAILQPLNGQPAQDILFHFGGPGDNGVETVVQDPNYLHHITGPQLNIIGFDPRGVGKSGSSLGFVHMH